MPLYPICIVLTTCTWKNWYCSTCTPVQCKYKYSTGHSRGQCTPVKYTRSTVPGTYYLHLRPLSHESQRYFDTTTSGRPGCWRTRWPRGKTDNGCTMIQSRSIIGSSIVAARLAKQIMTTMDQCEHSPIPFTETSKIVQQGKTYAAVVMGIDHECDQNGQARDCKCSSPRSESNG